MAEHGGLHITSTTYGGEASVPTNDDETFLWNTEQFNATATVETGNASGNYRACVLAQPVATPDAEPAELTCKPVTFTANEKTELSFTDLSAPENASGEFDLTIVVDDVLRSGDPVDTNVTRVTFLGPADDFDGDGLPNREDALVHGTEFNDPDTDNDTLSDGEEVNKYDTDPLDPDTDDDGLRDGIEVTLGMNPSQSAVPLYIGALALLGVVAFLVFRRFWPLISTSSTTPSAAGDPTTNGAGTGSSPDLSDDSTFVTDEDRILQILAENDGRLMQSRLVELTDWSKSKVSRRLSTLEEEGRVRKITLGRENMVALPGHEPDGAQSPFEEEQ